MDKLYSWKQITSQEDLENSILTKFSFHDGMLKEFYIANRGYVDSDLSMSMDHSLNGILLLQTQWKPGAINLLFIDIINIIIDSPKDFDEGTIYYNHSIGSDIIPFYLAADGLEIQSRKLYYRFSEDMLGSKAFLGYEIPKLK